LKVLITGSNGFIGKELCNCMEKKGFSLVKGLRTNTENEANTFSVGEIDGKTNWHDA